jgi:D-alanine-D-alanine ligase
MDASQPQWFLDCVRIADELASRVGVVLVVNLKGSTKPIDDYKRYSIATEFLSASELDDLVDGLGSSGLYSEVLIDEERFIDWLGRGRMRFPREIMFVYNIAQNGLGPARASLIPGLCRLYQIPLLDSDAYVAAITRHKFHANAILHYCGLPVAYSWSFTRRGWWPAAPPNGLRLIAKPTFDSASIGISEESVFEMNANTENWLRERCAEFRQPLTVQEFVSGYEVEVPIFGGKEPHAIAAVGIELNGRRQLDDSVLTYDDVACDRYSFYDFSLEHMSAARQAMQSACKVFECLGLAGVGRVDFRVRQDGSPVVMELASKPHLTKHSSFAFAMKHIGCAHSELFKFLVGSALKRQSSQN